MKFSVLLLIVLLSSASLFGQKSMERNCRKVLRKDIPDSLFVFGEWNEKGGEEIRLRYLGMLESPTGKIKVMTSCWLWGISHRASNKILLFDDQDRYLGYYYLFLTSDLPEKIEDNELVFLHSQSDDCDKTLITRVPFREGIPETFFLDCSEGSGDEYRFLPESGKDL